MNPAAAARLPKTSTLRSRWRFFGLRVALDVRELRLRQVPAGRGQLGALSAPARALALALGIATSRVASARSEARSAARLRPSAISGAALTLVSFARSRAPSAASLDISRTCSRTCETADSIRGSAASTTSDAWSMAWSSRDFFLRRRMVNALPLLGWMPSIMPHEPDGCDCP